MFFHVICSKIYHISFFSFVEYACIAEQCVSFGLKNIFHILMCWNTFSIYLATLGDGIFYFSGVPHSIFICFFTVFLAIFIMSSNINYKPKTVSVLPSLLIFYGRFHIHVTEEERLISHLCDEMCEIMWWTRDHACQSGLTTRIRIGFFLG